MSSFLPNIPQPGDNLDFSQGQLLSNNQGLDTVFHIDHTLFSDATANKGFHNQVTSIPQGGVPATTANPILYAFQQTVGMGALQYSRGPINAVPSPLTRLNSPSTPISLATNATTNIMDFTGLSIVIAVFSAFDSATAGANKFTEVYWNGSTFTYSSNPAGLTLQQSGNILQLKNQFINPVNNVYWSLEFQRAQ